MIISDQPPLLFVHIPKTAGVSISRALVEGNTKHPLCIKSKHETAAAFIARNGPEAFHGRHTFSVVRHPLNRFLSQYAFMKKHQDKWPQFESLRSPDDFVDAIERNDTNIIIRIEQILPQCAYITLDGAICVDDVLRHEAIESEFRNFCAKIGLAQRHLPQANRTNAKLSPSEKVKAFVTHYYAEDFRLFGY
ncbi:unannotated protein [freshwater metagenome]|uniref:Unannotated protein n=1 Tax=freshwater metagenome TaxID=449393 RepID=A0A6J6Z6P1_9ZZZZ